MGSMNMPGISLTLLNLSNVSEECNIPVEKLLEMLDAPHNSPAWPQTSGIYPLPKDLERGRKDAWIDVEKEEKVVKKGGKQILGTSEFLF
jgi:dihydroxyacetone kinase